MNWRRSSQPGAVIGAPVAGDDRVDSVRTRDAQGGEIRPWQDGGYDRVAVVLLEWPFGQTVERALLTRDGLDCVFGE